ncbi:helix-turn-helix domain-containing protein [Promicromonospora vindobonensis]|uniref:Helix-turn-helix domain-containing protein n=1 Tax=Promicromonospora vindobonensis TaxID=195748 RepID=A0ABW5VMN5_9MICO
MALGRQIKAERSAAGLTLEELSARIGVHKNTLHNYEKGEREMTYGVLAALAHEFGLDSIWALVRAAEERADRE